MSARRHAKVVPLPGSAPAKPLASMLMEQPEGGLRVLLLALHGLEEATQVFDLDSDDVQREVGPLIALTYDIQAALERAGTRIVDRPRVPASVTPGTGPRARGRRGARPEPP
jgi:hypothetical protein